MPIAGTTKRLASSSPRMSCLTLPDGRFVGAPARRAGGCLFPQCAGQRDIVLSLAYERLATVRAAPSTAVSWPRRGHPELIASAVVACVTPECYGTRAPR